MYQLGLPATGNKIEMLHQLNDHLLKNNQNGITTVVMVDEAQAIQDEQIFEELRLLLNFQLNDRFLLTLVLLGQPELQDRLQAIPQLAQRIAVRSHLVPLNEDETAAYEEQIGKAVSADPEVEELVNRIETEQRNRDDSEQEVPSGDALAIEFQRFLKQRDSD